MEFKGKIIAVLPLTKGVSKSNGNEWKKQEYVIENDDRYPRKMCFNLWSEKIDEFNIQLGEKLNVFFDIDCREYNGRWYNDIRAWKIEREAGDASANAGQFSGTGAPVMPDVAPEIPQASIDDDLPF